MTYDHDTLADLRHDARQDAIHEACERDFDRWADSRWSDLATQFLADRKLESDYRDWLRENRAEFES